MWSWQHWAELLSFFSCREHLYFPLLGLFFHLRVIMVEPHIIPVTSYCLTWSQSACISSSFSSDHRTQCSIIWSPLIHSGLTLICTCAESNFYKQRLYILTGCLRGSAKMSAKSDYFHQKVAWFNAKMYPVWCILLNEEYPPKLMNNQKTILRRQKGNHMAEGYLTWVLRVMRIPTYEERFKVLKFLSVVVLPIFVF